MADKYKDVRSNGQYASSINPSMTEPPITEPLDPQALQHEYMPLNNRPKSNPITNKNSKTQLNKYKNAMNLYTNHAKKVMI